ncbi:MBL fold metallo-hydrolase [Nocardioides cavernae]|uniref:MBL fold metallo-hydrolase n=1 Tax=Nocardioides cavernae TaxID=1921566 RepID=A0ABR8NGA2_9ACTN|nr:MBL fold metallo-hydrolase [Nocardioides cavernae]MBD3926175.1 MBL fold metallo-hydrolase [Nocardioides cavernae]MBM7513767.1 glyoxylase-like metal-dependent hydrolase (beta-lactamase superfamily II) [Nocardioides cavernae]
MSVDVHPIAAPWGRFALYSYLIDAPELAIVDTGVAASAANVPAELEKLGRRIEDVRWILLTHGHIDHVGGADALWEATGRRAEVVISATDAHFLRSRRSHVEEALELRGSYVDAATLEERKSREVLEAVSGELEPTRTVGDGDVLDLGGTTVRVVAVPGHTAGAVAYVVDSDDVGGGAEHVFVGDAAQCYGAASGFPGYEDPDAYRASLERVLALDPQHLYLGHPYRQADGTPFPVVLDDGGARAALTASLAREAEVRAAMTSSTPTASGSAYAPFAEHAARLGYTGDPTLEPSPFFTTMRGYLCAQLKESTHA